ncbi:MAG TPA: ABC transporter permease [Firmicutes bacterium]|jgi:ABC-2 type transport system permease protein|nr:ABC transporter permease [Bacillota bacterium]
MVKEVRQIVRDKATLAIIFVMPIMMLFIFGYAVSTDVDQIPTVVFNQDPGPSSRYLLERFSNSGYFRLEGSAGSLAEVRSLIDSGKMRAALVIPPDYANLLQAGDAQVQLLIDGSDPLLARSALSAGGAIVQAYAVEILQEKASRAGLGMALAPPLELRTRVWFNPNLESLRFNLPGLVGVVLQNITILLTAFALVRERELGTIEQLIVTPIKPMELVLGKLIPYVVIAFIEVGLTLAVTALWFGIAIAGSITLLLSISFLFLIGALGIGLLISTVAQNQLQAMQMTFAFLLPSILLSGFIFPREAMPAPVSALGYAIPLTYFLQVLRGIIVKGVGFMYLWRETLLLGVYGLGILLLAAARFRKRLD